MRTRLLHASDNVLAALLGMAAGHLVAALTIPAASPVLAVGSTVIDLTPTPLKEWAVAQFGTADKPILVGSVMVVVLVLVAGAGALAGPRRRVAAALLAGLALVAAVLAALRPEAGTLAVVPGLAAAVVGAGGVFALHAARADAQTSRGEPGVGPSGASRRSVVLAASMAVAAAALGGTGQWITKVRLRVSDLVLPMASDVPEDLPAGLDGQFDGISPLRTPNSDFYRVDTRLTLPVVDPDGWSLKVDGDVDRAVELSLDDLFAMDVIERDITLTCVSNEVGGSYVGAARWRGVRLTDVLDLAGTATTGADQILCTDVDGMTISTPLAVATDGRDAMLAFGMNGAPLPRAHGFPVRMVVPGLYGFVSACKWITRMTLTTYDEQQAYWTERDWAVDAPVRLSSRIDTPRPFSDNAPGRLVIGGVAWAQGVGVGRVEVRIDGGQWRPARLGPDVGDDYWRQWYLEWDATPGQHFVAVRATNLAGETQTAVRRTPFPSGSSGIQEISINVRS